MRHDVELKQFIADWRAGKPVQVIELGGFGDGYETAIWDFSIEVLDKMLDGITTDPEDWQEGRPVWESDKEFIRQVADALCEDEGLTGAQYSAGLNGATVLFRNGHAAGLAMAPDRVITLSKAMKQNPYMAGSDMAEAYEKRTGIKAHD